jgi:hypothetical protein
MSKIWSLPGKSYACRAGKQIVRTIAFNKGNPRQSVKCAFDGREISSLNLAQISLKRELTEQVFHETPHNLNKLPWVTIQIQNISFVLNLSSGLLKGEQFLQMPLADGPLAKGLKDIIGEFTVFKQKSPFVPHCGEDKVTRALWLALGLFLMNGQKDYGRDLFATHVTMPGFKWAPVDGRLETMITASPPIPRKDVASAGEIFDALSAIHKLIQAA